MSGKKFSLVNKTKTVLFLKSENPKFEHISLKPDGRLDDVSQLHINAVAKSVRVLARHLTIITKEESAEQKSDAKPEVTTEVESENKVKAESKDKETAKDKTMQLKEKLAALKSEYKATSDKEEKSLLKEQIEKLIKQLRG